MMENSGAIQTFVNTEFGNIRMLKPRHAALNDTLTGKILFCGKDVAEALGYSNPRKALDDHCPHVTKRDAGVKTGIRADGSDAVQVLEMSFIPEGDVYRLIVRSNLPTAEKFERWVFDEVLPSIRKTGGYILSSPADTLTGKILFCGKDVAEALGYCNSRDAIIKHCRGVAKRVISTESNNRYGPFEREVEMSFIPEGYY